MEIEISLRLNFIGRRDINRTVMADWIKKAKDQFDADEKKRVHRAEVFGPKSTKLFEDLVSKIKADVVELNAECEAMMKGTIEVNNRLNNGRKMVPAETELHLDKQGHPEIHLTVILDIAAESVKISRKIRINADDQVVDSSERIGLRLTEKDEVILTQKSAYSEFEFLSVDRASEKILSIFIKPSEHLTA